MIDWTKVETEFSKTGALPTQVQPGTEIYYTRIRDFRFRRADALLRTHSVDPIQKIRTLICRGRLQEASHELAEYSRSELRPVDSEILLERSRIEAFSGNWSEAASLATLGLASQKTSAPTRMTLLQIRSVARYELEKFEEALADIEEIKTLSEILPADRGLFYAKVLESKCLALKSQEMLLGLAKSLLKKSLDDVKSPDLDHILTYLRAESDLCRLDGKEFEPRSLASMLISSTMGDSLYETLSLCDLSYSRDHKISQFFTALMVSSGKSFSRIDKMRASPESSVSAKILALAKNCPNTTHQKILTDFSLVAQIILVDCGICIDLINGCVTKKEISPQFATVLQALSSGTIEKEALFKKLWPGARYDKQRNDGTLRALLNKLRDAFKIEIHSDAGTLTLQKTLII